MGIGFSPRRGLPRVSAHVAPCFPSRPEWCPTVRMVPTSSWWQLLRGRT